MKYHKFMSVLWAVVAMFAFLFTLLFIVSGEQMNALTSCSVFVCGAVLSLVYRELTKSKHWSVRQIY